MKFIKSKSLQKAEGRKKGKYLITLEVTDYDIEMFEDLVHCVIEKEEETRYNNYIKKVFHTIATLWKKYD